MEMPLCSSKPIVILTATELEQHPLRKRLGTRYAGRRLEWRIGGMGAGATAGATLRILQELDPRAVIQAGIGGTFPQSALPLATTVLVGSDRQADLGAWRSETERFEPFAQLPEAQPVDCPYVDPLRERFRVVAARSLNSACAPIPHADTEAVESMEGAAFFSVCRAAGRPFYQLRAISNRVGDPRSAWRIPEALQSLADGLVRLLEALNL